MQSNEMRIMLLHAKVSDNLLRLFGKMKHKSTVKICMICTALFGISTKKISMLILY